jgi:hypothetical protein
MSKLTDTVIYVTTPLSEKKYWIKIHRNNKYTQRIIPNHKVPSKLSDPEEWKLVQPKRRNQPHKQPIYYWVVSEHNLFDPNDESYRLFFTDPDATQIENIDQNNYMAIDRSKQLRLIHVHLKHKGMKMTPTYFIARTVQQIEDALHLVKYCVVKIDNNEQKFISI